MRVPMSWLRELVELPEGVTGREVGDRLVRAGLEVEQVAALSPVRGPVVVGQVLSAEPEPQKNGKTINWCSVRVAADGDLAADGGAAVRGIVCGAHNFGPGDKVVVTLPGSVLAGGFAIAARKTYGHVSDGMIASTAELGLGDDGSDGILVLDPAVRVGAPALAVLGLDDEVLDLSVTPDRGYCLSMRGIAREVAASYGVPFADPVDLVDLASVTVGGGWPVRVDDPAGCPVFTAVTVEGVDPTRPSPDWLAARVRATGVRSISLAVDITNLVMMELGQPLHAYDADALTGPVVVRRAEPGEKVTTLDDVVRELVGDELLITDDTGPIGLAGVMGGASTEIGPTTSRVVVEAAHFEATTIGRTARRQHLPSEASKRFERTVDPAVPLAAGLRAATLLAELGGGHVASTVTVVGSAPGQPTVELPVSAASSLVGVEYSEDEVRAALTCVGALVSEGGGLLQVRPPSWRPDLQGAHDLVEEVARLGGYERIPSVLPVAPPGRGLTEAQRLRRRAGLALAGSGYREVLSYPFVGADDLARLRLEPGDVRMQAVRLVNPISETQPLLRTTLLPGLLAAARRNLGRGSGDLALFESGLVFRPDADPLTAPVPGVSGRPSVDELAALDAAVPHQPRRFAVVLTGQREPPGWWGPGRPADWSDAVAAAHLVAEAAGVTLVVDADTHAPWHPGRCARLSVSGVTVGHAGELHPAVCQAFDLPPRTCAMEVDLSLLGSRLAPAPAPVLHTQPVALQDVALVVEDSVPAAAVRAALVDGAGDLLDDVVLFDAYRGDPVPAGSVSLAFSLRFRAADRTLTSDEVTAAREGAVAEAVRRTGATPRR